MNEFEAPPELNKSSWRADIAIVGSALAGSIAALAFASRHVAVHLIGPKPDDALLARETRSTALFGPSVVMLRRLGVLREPEVHAEPLVALRLVDALGGLLRAPEVLFEANEIGERSFGVNVENGPLLAALARRIEQNVLIRWHTAPAASIEPREGDVVVRLAGGEGIAARLVVGADGARSLSRAAAGIEARQWEYPQIAIACRFNHARSHNGTSIELHRRAGPLTTVPLSGARSSLVWVEAISEAERLMSLSASDFACQLEDQIGDYLGRISELGPRASFPLAGAGAAHLAARRIALVGEAAHRLPPIGAQGLNLGLRDVAWIADIASQAVEAGRDPGADDVLDAYDRARRADVASRSAAVDVLNRSLFMDLLPLDLARGAGLAALKAVSPLRHGLMREGMGPGEPLPSLMHPL